MAKKTISEVAEEAQILADDLAEMAGTVGPDPIPDIFKLNEPVTPVQLRQWAYKMQVQAKELIQKAAFMEANASNMNEYRPLTWRTYASMYLDNAEDQMRIGLEYCLRRMQEDAEKLKSGSEPMDVEFAGVPDVSTVTELTKDRSMAKEFKEIGREIDEFRKEIEEMMD